MAYDAFISYSHSADGKLAPALQRALKSLAKPWYRLRALAVFRDETDLSAVPNLTAVIRGALATSRFFVYLASPTAAQSRWVGEEIETWKRRDLPDRLLVAVTEGEVEWSAAAADFDWNKSSALHPNLKGVFTQEPLWVDLRWAKSDRTLSSRDPRFQRATAMLAAPMHGKTLEELVGEDVRQHRRTQWLMGTTMTTLTLLLALFIGATVIASRLNTQLQSKLTLVEQVLPFFQVKPADAGGAPNPVPAWRQVWDRLRNSLYATEMVETWIEFDRLPGRLALRADCTSARQETVGGNFDCPKQVTHFDNDGLRSDIPGLAVMVDTLVRSVNDGRALNLLREGHVQEDKSADNYDPGLAAKEDLRTLVEHADILLPDRAWNALPERFRAEKRADHFQSRRHFEIWRQPIRKTVVDSEMIVIRMEDSAFCGSAGCTNPTVGFLRVGLDYALVFAQTIWGDIALYDAGPGNMPQIFSIGLSQSGVQQQYRAIMRSMFDAECVCYRPYLTGRVTSFERSADQRVPSRLKDPTNRGAVSQDRQAQAAAPGVAARDTPRAPSQPVLAAVVRIEDIEGMYDLTSSSFVVPGTAYVFSKGRLEIRRLKSNRVLLLMACAWRDARAGSSCWDWHVLEWRDGQLFGVEGRVRPLTALIFEPQTGSITLRSWSGPSRRLDVFVPAEAGEITDPELKRRMRAARNSWTKDAEVLEDPKTKYSVRVELIQAEPTQVQPR